MSDINQKATTTVVINGDQAREKLKDLQKEAQMWKKLMVEAGESGNTKKLEQYKKEFNKVTGEIRVMQRAAVDVDRVLSNLSTSGPKELQRTLKALIKEQENIKRGTKAWDELQEKIKSVRSEISRVNSESRKSEGIFSRLSNSFNKYATLTASVFASITGVVFSMKKSVSDYAEIDKKITDTTKFTGLTGEALDELQEKFKRIDTASTRQQLNDLAAEAGKLGKTTKEAVIDYVEGADIINIALDDLGEGATKDIGKLAEIYGDAEKMGLKNAMLAIGSAINEVSQNSTASASYLVEFENRMAGIGKQADISVPKIMGYASVLDQNAQKVEMAATAMQGIIMKMYKEPEKLAKIAGVDIQKFVKLIKEDANEALLYLLDTLGKAGGIEALAPIFNEMSLDGARASSVLSVLAGNIGKIRSEQELAQKAFDEGTSVIREFNIQNNNVQSQLEKNRKGLQEISYELGKMLLPYMKYFLSSASITLRVLKNILEFLIEHKGVIISLAAGVAAYTVAIKVNTIATAANNVVTKTGTVLSLAYQAAILLCKYAFNLLRGQTIAATRAMVAFNAICRTNPGAVLIGVLTVSILALKKYTNETKKAEKATSDLDKIKKEISSSYSGEEVKINNLTSIIHNNNLSNNTRINAIQQLKSLIPEYTAELSKEGNIIHENTQAVENYIKAKRKKAIADATENKLAGLQGELIDLKMKHDESQKKYEQQKKETPLTYYMGHSSHENIDNMMKLEQALYETKRDEIKSVIADIENLVVEFIEEENKILTLQKEEKDFPRNNDISVKEKEKKLENQYAIDRTKEVASYVKGDQDKAEMNEAIYKLDKKLLEDKMALYKKESAEYAKLQEERYNLELEHNERSLSANREKLQKTYDDTILEWKAKYAKGEISKDAYNKALLDEELSYLEHLKDTYELGSKERADIEKRIEETLLKDKLSKRDEYEKRKEALLKKYGAVTGSELYQLELKALDDLHNAKLISEENYLNAKRDLAKKYHDSENENADKSWLETDQGKAMIRGTQEALSAMQTIFEGFNSYVSAEQELELAKIERKYDKEVSAANGNEKKIAEIEKRKETEIAKIKQKFAKKSYEMQILQAVAQTVMSSINAYSSAAAIPLIGYIMAPIAAAAALTAGYLQVNAIKKQAQAAEVTGYMQGGFTGDGTYKEEKGVVHAGEFVANRHAVRNKQLRPVFNLIDTAQRNNTIGSLTLKDVYKTISRHIEKEPVTNVPEGVSYSWNENSTMIMAVNTLQKNREIMELLEKRLNEPFYTINTVTGEDGIKQAQDKYNKLIRNKSPKKWK